MPSLPPASGAVGSFALDSDPAPKKAPPRYGDLAPRPAHEGRVCLPIAMFTDKRLNGAPLTVAAFMAVKCYQSFRYWRTPDDLAADSGLSASSVRKGIARLKEAGWLHQVEETMWGKPRTVFVLAWKLEDRPPVFPALREPARSRPDPREISRDSARDLAPPPGPPLYAEPVQEQKTCTLTRAGERAGDPPSPSLDARPPQRPQEASASPDDSTAEPIASGPPGDPPVASEDQIRAWLSDLARPRTPAMLRKLAMWGLQDAGRLPAEFAGKVPPRPAEPVQPRPSPAPPAPSPSSRPPTTVELIERLASPCGPEAIEAAVRKLTDEWEDHPYTPFHRGWMTDVAEGRLRVDVPVRLYKQVRNLNRDSRARIFTSGVKGATGAHEKPAVGAHSPKFPDGGLNRSEPQTHCTVVK